MNEKMHCLHSIAHRTGTLYVYRYIDKHTDTLQLYAPACAVYIEDTTRPSQWQRWKEREKNFILKPLLNLWHCLLEHWYLMTGRCRAIWILTCPGLKQTQIVRYFNFPRQGPASHSEAICRHRADSRKNGHNGQGIWFDPWKIAFYSACLRKAPRKCCQSCETEGCQSTFATLVMACPGTQFLLSGAI